MYTHTLIYEGIFSPIIIHIRTRRTTSPRVMRSSISPREERLRFLKFDSSHFLLLLHGENLISIR